MPGWMKWAVSILIGFTVISVGFKYAGWLLTSFFVMNCLVLIIVVLLQSGKAADLAGAFGGAGSQTAFGPRGAATILSQATTWCAVMFMICAMAMVLRTDKAVEQGGGSILQSMPKPEPAKKTPAASTPVPVTPAPQTNSAPATQAPATQAPAPTQPAPAPPKK
jgi:preprotein translocase subunit SecG